MAKLKVLQIGAGGFGQSWLQVVRHHPDAELVAVADLSPQHLQMAQETAALADSQLYIDPQQAIREAGADIALIVTPQQTHKPLTLAALEGGLHVLMEKPLSHSYEDGVELLLASRQYEQRVMVSQNYRWFAPVQALKKLLAAERIGRIGYVEYQFRTIIHASGWRDSLPEVLLEDMSIHHFDILRYLLGKEAIDVYASSFQTCWSWWKGKPAASVILRFEDDVHVNYFGSWVPRGSVTSWNGDIRFVGERGEIVAASESVTWRETNEQGETLREEQIPLPEMVVDPRSCSLSELVQAIREEREPLTALADNIFSFELTRAAVESARSGQRIELAQFRQF